MELFPYLSLLFYLKHFHLLNFALETLCLFGVRVSFILWEGPLLFHSGLRQRTVLIIYAVTQREHLLAHTKDSGHRWRGGGPLLFNVCADLIGYTQSDCVYVCKCHFYPPCTQTVKINFLHNRGYGKLKELWLWSLRVVWIPVLALACYPMWSQHYKKQLFSRTQFHHL